MQRMKASSIVALACLASLGVIVAGLIAYDRFGLRGELVVALIAWVIFILFALNRWGGDGRQRR